MTEQTLTAIALEVLSPASKLIGKPQLTGSRWTIGFKHREFSVALQVQVTDQPETDAGKQRTRQQIAESVGRALANQQYD